MHSSLQKPINPYRIKMCGFRIAVTLYKPQIVGGTEMKSAICLAESAKMREMFKFTLGVSRQRCIYLIFCV